MSESNLEDRAINAPLDWDALRKSSLLPGGFGDHRVNIWPRLLNAKPSPSSVLVAEENDPQPPPAPQPEPHHDEHQIHLDTERSFVFYPVGSMHSRQILQGQLDRLLVSLFQKRRKLSYFQGYHDIITVLFLTLPPALHLPCAEQLSLHRVRDSMGSSLEPVLGLLRVLKNLLRLADPGFAALLERNSPLPFYALSNLLTLFSHDVPTLPLIQHVFDYLLCRPPISAVYLGAAILLARKQEAERLEEEGEEGMVHSLLSGLPELLDGNEEAGVPLQDLEDAEEEEEVEVDDEKTDVDALEESVREKDGEMLDDTPDSLPISEEETVVSTPSSVFSATADIAPIVESDASPADTDTDTPDLASTSSNLQASSRPPSTTPSEQGQGQRHTEYDAPSRQSPSPEPTVHRLKISLTALLERADALYAAYPPTDPALALSAIMGPQSVVFTWSEDPAQQPADDAAEALVLRTELVVLPHAEPGPPADAGGEKETRRRSGTGKQPRSARSRRLERRAMVAGAVLVLGISVAVYGARGGQGGARAWRKLGVALLGSAEQFVEGVGLWF